jgi:hypothetical protein
MYSPAPSAGGALRSLDLLARGGRERGAMGVTGSRPLEANGVPPLVADSAR